MNGRSWSPQDEFILRQRYANTSNAELSDLLDRAPRAISLKARKMGLAKSAEYTATAGRFQPGQEPPNKGRPQAEWMPAESRKRCSATQFQKGELSGRARELRQPIGAERVSKDGYIERKVHDGMPLQSRWRGVHLIRWEEINGPLPPGHALVFRDGNKANTAPENMELVSRAELMRRNSYWNNYPREVAELNQLRGAITRKINRKRKDREEQSQRRA